MAALPQRLIPLPVFAAVATLFYGPWICCGLVALSGSQLLTGLFFGMHTSIATIALLAGNVLGPLLAVILVVVEPQGTRCAAAGKYLMLFAPAPLFAFPLALLIERAVVPPYPAGVCVHYALVLVPYSSPFEEHCAA